jgi:hypothetical protein
MKSGKVLIPSAAAIGLMVLLTAIGFFLWPFVAAGQTSFINCRFGFAAVWGDPSDYSDIDRLHAGWYHHFRTELDPTPPEGMEHVQVIRLHQSKESPCGAYTTPYTYTLRSPPGGWTTLGTHVENNEGSLWLIGNEMDRRDWESDGACDGQDEMLPSVYAVAYHELYHAIKGWDPTAKVAIGGVIQATPLRLQYLDMILDEYQTRYGEKIPVDVWNVHGFILREESGSSGADIPPGISATQGKLYRTKDNDNMSLFKQQIVAFRQWMAEKGERNKPLIVTEYGINMSPDLEDEDGNDFDAVRVRNFMYATFDYFLGSESVDTSLGYPPDENRLVQRWNWYSLDDDEENQWGQIYNGNLFDSGRYPLADPKPKGINFFGEQWEIYITDPSRVPAPHVNLLPARIFSNPATPYSPTDPITLTLKAEIANSGSKAVEGSFVVRFYEGPPPPGVGNQIGTYQTISNLCGCGGAETVEVTWANVSPGAHQVYVVVDAEGTIPESNEDDNTGSGVILVATNRILLPLITKAYSP